VGAVVILTTIQPKHKISINSIELKFYAIKLQ